MIEALEQFRPHQEELRRRLIRSFLAVVPGMLCFTIVGNEFSFRNPLFWVILLINLCMIAGGFWYTRRRLKQKTAAAEPAPTTEEKLAALAKAARKSGVPPYTP